VKGVVLVKLVVDNVFTTAVSESSNDLQIIEAALQYEVKNWQQIKRRMLQKYRNSSYWKGWQGKKSFFESKHNAFLTGLLGKVVQSLRAYNVGYEVIDKRKAPVSGVRVHPNALKGITMDGNYDYQLRAANEFIAAGRGVVKLPTGGGKTEVAIAVTKTLNLPTLFLTHRVNLLHQTAKRFADRCPSLVKRIGLIGDGQYSPNFITLATVQTLQSVMKRDPDEFVDLMAQFRLVIIDEAHRSGCDQFNRPAMLAKNAYFRMALTATPFMKGNAQEDLLLMGITAPVVTTVTNAELIERGILARPFFKFYDVNGPDLTPFRKWADIYERGIVHNAERNHLIVKTTGELASQGKKMLIIVQQKAHGTLLNALSQGAGVKAQYIDGSNAYAEREKAIKWLQRSGQALVVTNIFDEGVDCNAIDSIVLAAGTKSAPTLFQRAGRAVRRKEKDNYAIVIDFIDKQHPKLLEHSMRRYNLIKNERGFTIL
jgi:superfamily II DNA or RNA helicase